MPPDNNFNIFSQASNLAPSMQNYGTNSPLAPAYDPSVSLPAANLSSFSNVPAPPAALPQMGVMGNFDPQFRTGGIAGGSLLGGVSQVTSGGAAVPTAMPQMGTLGKLGLMAGKYGGMLSKGIGMLGGLSPVGAGLFGLMGLASARRNRPKDINQDFKFDLASSDYNVNRDLTRNMNQLSGLGGQFAEQAQNMLNPNSTYNQRQFDTLRRGVGDQSAQSINAMNSAMASRGAMGMGNLYDAISSRQAGDQFAQGQMGILNQGTQLASQMGNTAMSAYGQAGQLASGVDSRRLQNNQFNTQNENTYNQQLKMAEYNQAVQNQNARAAYGQSQSNNMFNLAGSFLGLGRK